MDLNVCAESDKSGVLDQEYIDLSFGSAMWQVNTTLSSVSRLGYDPVVMPSEACLAAATAMITVHRQTFVLNHCAYHAGEACLARNHLQCIVMSRTCHVDALRHYAASQMVPGEALGCDAQLVCHQLLSAAKLARYAAPRCRQYANDMNGLLENLSHKEAAMLSAVPLPITLTTHRCLGGTQHAAK